MKRISIDPELLAAKGTLESGSAVAGRSITIPWGPEGSLDLRLPAAGPIALADVDVVWPDLSGPLDDYPGALEHALEAPVGFRAAGATPGSGRPGGDHRRRSFALDARP